MYDRSKDLIVVAMPLYGHAALALEALETVLASETVFRTQIVVSVDGDPRREVFDSLTLYAAAHPNIHIIFGENAGPGGARNRAVDYILEEMPDVKAVYFVDADNRVQPHTIDTLYRKLLASNAGWVYTNIDTFSVNWRAHYGDSYSRLIHCITDNICDTGSMISAEVFRSGVRFDDDRQNGFEDWEFWLSAIEAGFVGAPCHDTGFEYRLRAESRFKEANRDRSGSISFLRKRHKALFRRPTLVGFEHEECPRYGVIRAGEGTVSLFTDLSLGTKDLKFDDAIRAFWGSVSEPDNFHFPPFLASSNTETLKLLARSRLLPNILSRLEKLSEQANIVFVELTNVEDERRIDTEIMPSGTRQPHADLIFVSTKLIKDIIENDALDWFASLGTQQLWPTSARMKVRFPFPRVRQRRALSRPEQSMLNLVTSIATSPLKQSAAMRWTWRPRRLPALSEMYQVLRNELGGGPVLPLAHNAARKKTAAVLVPNASFGGAEKVAYAAGRELKNQGFETHLFVLGNERMDVLDEFDQSFDYLHFWKDGIPAWGDTNRFLGQDFITDDHPLDWSILRGQLSGFDLVVNNHVMAAHPLMGKLRSEGTRTACYLHVVDETVFRRQAGQPYAAIAFEHAYDAFLTCSDQLKIYLHSFGVPYEKVFSVPNGASFSIDTKLRTQVTAARKQGRKGEPIRMLYMGRLDRQKGIDRLHDAIVKLKEQGIPFEAQAIGGEILSDDPSASWMTRLKDAGVKVSPPVFDGKDIANHLAWADVLLMPSRWEGAPLMIAEAQQLGCVPVATAVGAVDELINHGRDGILIRNGNDAQIVSDMTRILTILAQDREALMRTAEGALASAAHRTWSSAFSEFTDWANEIRPAYPKSRSSQPDVADAASTITALPGRAVA
ncbi:glycosyltransferase [Brucella anthropi]|uniref:glycosyltransferase n=1 Tax=Brucella anthropi TaxID=529 RepID=UPI00124E9B16|nr:glycosyltransferase [Brucella anthropi]KAB2746555.1 glycosyltransferase [Brucella anthropi]MDH0367378.1 glycosyltransferase [Brucella anthropi]